MALRPKKVLKPVNSPKPLWGFQDAYEKVRDNFDFEETGNCGLIFCSNVGDTIKIKEHAYALRHAIADEECDNNYNDTYGAVMCTTVPRQRSTVTALRAAGFELLFQFKNPNTSNVVSVWSALAIK